VRQVKRVILGGLDYPFEWLLGDLAIRLEAPETFSVWRRDPSSPAQRRYRPRSRSFRGGVEKVYCPAVVQPAFYGDGQNIREIVRRSKGDTKPALGLCSLPPIGEDPSSPRLRFAFAGN
jgi:hypothetical protein